MKWLATPTAILPLAAWFGVTNIVGDVRLPAIFTRHMVLQRDQPVPVWGAAEPGESVTVRFDGQTRVATADASGQWRVTLAPMTARPDQLGRDLVVAGSTTITLTNVVVGDVWLGLGQSNMVIPVGQGGGYDRAYALDRDRPLIRYSPTPSDDQLRLLAGRPVAETVKPYVADWVVCTKDQLPHVGAILLAFADRLHQELNVPIGIINRAVGGTTIYAWANPEWMNRDAEFLAVYQRLMAEHDRWQTRANRYRELWEQYVAECKQRNLRVAGELPSWARDAELKKAYAQPMEAKFRGLHHQMIEPLAGLAVRGVVWDQGESGTILAWNRMDLGTATRALFRGWRTIWPELPVIVIQKPSGMGYPAYRDSPQQPFPVPPLPATPPRYPWEDGFNRENYLSIATMPGVFMTTTMDLPGSVHPTRKDLYGDRAARVALANVYGRAVVWRGPKAESAEFKDGAAVITFSHVGAGLVSRSGTTVQGFALAGSDKVFHWATATIDGNTVRLRSDMVAKPVAVRYAFAEDASWANLFNKDGFPALSFRADDWTEDD